ncbi:MAG: NAD(P)/FAD-dependent oxidoreductase [Actinomycetota bacterium]
MNETYDVVVIGAGPAGENAGDRAVKAGLRVAIVEKELVGGECSYWGCMPSKALLRPGEALAALRRVPGARAAITGEIDVDEALARRDSLSAGLDDSGQVEWVDSAGMDLIRGHGRLAGERTVEVTAEDGSVRTLVAEKGVIIGVGTGAAVPPIDGLREIRSWTNRDVTQAKEVPARLIVLGGGVIGVEMAQAMRWLGSEEVTIVEMADRLIPREEDFAGAELQDALEEMGITVITGARMVKAERAADDAPVTATLEDGRTVTGDEILVAIGRRPLTDDLGLDTVGLEPGRYVEVDDNLRATGVDGGWLYVVGDANGRALLTHQGKYQARIAGDHIGGKDVGRGAWADHTAVPRVVFTDPQIAAVGMTEAEARERYDTIDTVRYDMGHTAGAATTGQGISGTSQLVIDADRRVIVGATFVGPHVGEMLHAATIAIVGEVPLDRLWHAVPAYPTMSEIWLRFLEAYGM